MQSTYTNLQRSWQMECFFVSVFFLLFFIFFSQTAHAVAPSCTMRLMNISPSTRTAVLVWEAQNVTAATIDQGIGQVAYSGARPVSPSTWGLTYRLSVTGPDGSGFCTATMTKICELGDPNASQNPCYSINHSAIFPSLESVQVPGYSYTDTTPATLDLAQRAQLYIGGATRSLINTGIVPSGVFTPGSPGVFRLPTLPPEIWGGVTPQCGGNAPCIEDKSGAPNWGKVNLALFRAREMSGYDREDTAGTFSKQFRSVTHMLSYSVTRWLSEHGMSFIVLPPQWAGGGQAPMSVAMESLMVRYEQDLGNVELKNAIDAFVKMHKDTLTAEFINNTIHYYFYKQADFNKEQFGGYYGLTDTALQNGRGALALLHWYNLTGNTDAYDIGTKVTKFLREASGLWDNPDPSRFPNDGPGQYFGDPHAYMNAALAFLEEAEARLKNNGQDQIAKENIRRAHDMLEFTKRRTEAGSIGNFGAIGSTGDIMRVALKLSELRGYFPDLNVGLYYDQLERWTRNQLAEGQIDQNTANNYIGNPTSGNPQFDRIGDKSVGLFFTDATHAISIPFNTLRYDVDGPANAMRAMYEVWRQILIEKGNTAQVNMLLNRVGMYVDVKSDLPYRGRVEVVTKNSLGSIRNLMIHTPGWSNPSTTVVKKISIAGERTLAQGSEWSREDGGYIRIPNVTADSSYIITFPMAVVRMQVVELRDAGHWWYESTYPSPQGFAPETRITYNGTFLGYDLVALDHRPEGGVPRYQRNALSALISGDTVNEVAPPHNQTGRFSFKGLTYTPRSTTPTVSFMVNGQASIVYPGANYVIAWSSSNVTSCNVSYVSSITGETGSFGITPNTSGSGMSGLIGTYTMTCQSSTGPISRTVTITAPPASASCTLDGVTVAHGQSRTFYSALTHANCSSITQSRTCTNGTLSGSSSYQYASCTPPAGGSAPTITSTNTDDPRHGAIVIVTGTRFTSSNTVRMNTTVITTVSSTGGGTSLSFTVPTSLAAGTYTLTIQNANGTSNGKSLRVQALAGINWPAPPGNLNIELEMAPYIAAAGQEAAAWLQGDTLGNYLYGSQANLFLHGIQSAETGDPTGRQEIPCADIPASTNRLGVILVAGQSNAANSAARSSSGQFFTSNSPIYNLNIGNDKCYTTRNPILGADGAGQAFVYPLASYLIDAGIYDRVLIVPVAVSGTLIEQWIPAQWRAPDAQHFKRIQSAINRLSTLGLRPTLFLWHQGEGNSGSYINRRTPDGTPINVTQDLKYGGTLSWMRNFFRMVATLRDMGLTSMPIFVALATSCGSEETSDAIRLAQRSVADPVWNIYAGPDTDALPFSLRRPTNDNGEHDYCHFSHEGNLVHAQKWFEIIRAHLNPAPVPAAATLTANGQTTLVYPGQNYTLAWSSANVTGSTCTMSYTPATGTPGSFVVTANAAGSAQTGLVGTYTITCQSSTGPISRTVTITPAPQTGGPPTVSLTVNGQQSITLPPGANYTVAWSSSNATSCNLTNAQGATHPTPPNVSNSSEGGTVAGVTYTYTFACTNSGGTTSRTATVLPTAGPTITSTNTDDPMAGVDVIVSGTGFTSSNTILFNGSEVTRVASANGISLTFTVPTLWTPGAYTFTIRNTNGTSNSVGIRVHAPVSVAMTVNSQPSLTVPQNTTFNLVWSSQNAVSCNMAYSVNGGAPNTSAIALSGTAQGAAYLGSLVYTFTCTATNGAQRSQFVTITGT